MAVMKGLVYVLQFKIVGTLFAWCIPLILLPTEWVLAAGFPESVTGLIPKLLGWAYLALLVGYSHGLKAAMEGKTDQATVNIGIVSNLGAGIILLSYGFFGHWSDWGDYAQFHMWMSACSAIAISAGLFAFSK